MWTPPQDELVASTSKPTANSGTWTPPAEEAIGGATSDDSDPGMLKSAAAGLMSGIPLAETATAGIKSALGDKTYEEEHKSLEDLKDKAWDKHPYAYGAGKGTGIVGSSIVAPESLAGRLGLAAAMGAGYGVDESKKVSDIPLDAAKGAGMGVLTGGLVEGANYGLGKVLPKVAKGITSSLAGGEENVDAYLANRAGVNASLDPVPAAEKLADHANDISTAAGHLSEDAVSKLRPDVAPILSPKTPELPGMPKAPTIINHGASSVESASSKAPTIINHGTGTEDVVDALTGKVTPGEGGGRTVITHGNTDPIFGSMTPDASLPNSSKTVVTHGSSDPIFGVSGKSIDLGEDTLSKLFDPIEQKLAVDGVPVGQAQTNALNALQGYKNSLQQIAAKNGGKIPETSLGRIVRAMQDDVNWAVDDKVVNSAKKQFEGTVNDLLKTSNPTYGEAMKPVSELSDLGSDLKKTFKLDRDNEGILSNSDTTNSKMSHIADEGKTNTQELVNKLADLTGFDALKNAKLNDVKRALTSGGKSNQLLNFLGHTGGYIAGKLTGIPGAGLVGSLAGGAAGHAADGGQIAKSLMDRYLNGMATMDAHPAMKAALQKYGPMLVNAAKQGGNNLAATHFVLATSHPEYQELIEHTQDNQ